RAGEIAAATGARTLIELGLGAHDPDTGPYADDACGISCKTRARAHRDPLGERTAPPARLITIPQGTTAAPARLLRAPPSSAHPPPTAEHTTHDRGRAPPMPSST
ncbi:hypothetical protein ACWDEX_11755, partial [Streptomyces sp. NPDC001020]